MEKNGIRKKHSKVFRVLVMFPLFIIILMLIVYFSKKMYWNSVKDSVRQHFDLKLSIMNDYREEEHIIPAYTSSLSAYVPESYQQSEEFIALQAYLYAYDIMYDIPSHYRSEYEYESMWNCMREVPYNYDGYYAEEILRFRQEIYDDYSMLLAGIAQAGTCLHEGCENTAEVMAVDNGEICIFHYCYSHRCRNEGCDKDKVTTIYCREHAPWGSFCYEFGCDELVDPDVRGTRYCKRHRCSEAGCKEGKLSYSKYCCEHYRKYQNSQSSSSYRRSSSGSSGKKKSDVYDVYSFDDPDDFADEWAEEFGDGNFGDGWDDAWDYWHDNQ